ncbi:hypothetical protein ACHAWF_013558 [Thalassiosira exigua]
MANNGELNSTAMLQTIKKAMRKNNTDRWHISNTSTMRQHQELLILLHHARKCPHDENGDTICPVTPKCGDAKRIWQHIAECKDKKCTHCYSSRHVLTHYRECKDGMCQICAPVRQEIRRRKQQGQILKTDTFSTSMTPSTHPTTHPSTSTPRPNNQDTALAVTPSTNPMPKLTVAICRSQNNVGRIIPVRMRSRSFSSLSDISHGSSLISSRSSAPSSRSSGSVRHGRSQYKACNHPNCGGIKCRENLGIAHFIKEENKEEIKEW